MNRTAMSPASAVQLVAAWIETHGRPPSRQECRAPNGLPHERTLQYVCHGLTQTIALAQLYLAYGSAALSGMGRAAASACACSVRMDTCLRCDRAIVWDRPYRRLCDACRKVPGDELPMTADWVVVRRTLPRDDTEDLMEWDE